MITLIGKLATSNAVVLALLLLAFISDGTGWIKLSVTAAILHELGHITAYLLVFKKVPKIRLTIGGIQMCMENVLCKKKEFIVLIAGPLENFILFAGVYLFMQYFPASYNGYFFCAANLCMGIFNLLPIGFLDGGRLLENSLPTKYADFTYIIDKFMLWVIIAVAMVIAFYAQSAAQRVGILLVVVYLLIKSLR